MDPLARAWDADFAGLGFSRPPTATGLLAGPSSLYHHTSTVYTRPPSYPGHSDYHLPSFSPTLPRPLPNVPSGSFLPSPERKTQPRPLPPIPSSPPPLPSPTVTIISSPILVHPLPRRASQHILTGQLDPPRSRPPIPIPDVWPRPLEDPPQYVDDRTSADPCLEELLLKHPGKKRQLVLSSLPGKDLSPRNASKPEVGSHRADSSRSSHYLPPSSLSRSVTRAFQHLSLRRPRREDGAERSNSFIPKAKSWLKDRKGKQRGEGEQGPG